MDKAFDGLKFVEESAGDTKSHAWSQTTWILSLNAGLLAFSANLYAGYGDKVKISPEGLIAVEWLSALAGVVLCWMLVDVLGELGKHISNYWSVGRQLRRKHPVLLNLISKADQAEEEFVGLPPFCARLRKFALVFAATDIAWAIAVTVLVLTGS